ncbi:TetR/AcrR family transcriptional regulator [Rathayibacter soli]|uniref:TetR/AcrR family transcriptional regulator n=1 Tax=Rathayibacter soli TaxID=3144168 RepID=UPI0027E3F71E|nr:TetR/AcrR family transcriptional regulator [Glaciibacter superstes]
MPPSIPSTTVAPPRPNPSEELLAVAIEQFASVGFAGTSLQQIADAAGYSKSSVLYHFASKEALLEAALSPAIDRLELVLTDVSDLGGSPAKLGEFVEQFIDFLFAYRLEVHTFINQGQSLVGIPVIDRANATVRKLAETCASDFDSVEDQLRFGVALGGAAYALVAGANFGDANIQRPDGRAALITIVTGLLAPASAHTHNG